MNQFDFYPRFVAALGLWLLAGMAHSVSLQPFADAEVVNRSTETVSDYVLALGNYKKVGGMWQVESQSLAGELERTTYQLPGNVTPRRAYEHFLEQLRRYPLRELYSCQKRDCGNSNSWATNHFGVLQLYGLDDHQHYGAFELNTPEQGRVYVTLYTVLRGNKRVYAQVEILKGQSEGSLVGDADTLKRQLQRDGFVVFGGLKAPEAGPIKLLPEHVAVLAEALELDSAMQVALVGHNYRADGLERQRELSRSYAELLQKALVDRGLDKERLTTYGLGGLAPAGRGDDPVRIDVVLLD